MSSNPFELPEDNVAPTVETPPQNPFVLPEDTQARRLRLSLDIASKANPEQSALAQHIARTANVPLGVVERNLPEFQRQAKLADLNPDRLATDAPATARFLSDVNAAKLAHDDVERLAELEALMRQSSITNAPSALYDTLGDVSLSVLKGAVGLPQAVVGLADIPTLGRAGKALESIGYRPAQAQKIIESVFSSEMRASLARVQNADGFFDALGTVLTEPRALSNTIIESLPLMLGGAGIARGANAALLRIPGPAPLVLPPIAAGAFGEGVIGAGAAASQIREQTADGELTPAQAGAAVASGVGTGLLGALGGTVATRFGIGDIDAALAAGQLTGTPKAGFAKQVIGSGITEGFFEELPQSAQEQMWQNFAMDRPLLQGVANAAAVGLVAGAVTGGAFGTYNATLAALIERSADAQEQVQRALTDAQRLRQAMVAAAQSQLRERSPETFQQLVEQIVAENEGAQSVFIDGQVLAQSGIDIAQAFPSLADQVNEAAFLNSTVEIPLAEVLTAVPGTPLEELFLQNAKSSPDALSQAEVQQAGEQGQQFIQQEAERVLQQAQEREVWQTEVDTVQQTIKGQLDQAGRFTSDVNESYARLQSQFFSVMASRFGITPSEMYERFSVKVAGQMGQGEVLNAQYDQGDVAVTDQVDPTTGLPLNADGTVTLYHHTSAANAEAIRQSGALRSAGEPDVYLTTRETPDTGYGDAAVKVRVDPSKLQLDDEFPDGRMDFRINVGRPGGALTGAEFNQSATIRQGKETLKKYGLDPTKSYKTREVAAALEARQRTKYGTIATDDRSETALANIAKWMVAEVEFEMQNPEKSGVGWYSEKFQRALDIMGDAFPELKTDKTARNTMTALIAITSDGQKVVPNFAQAMDIYGNFREAGKFTTTRGHQRQASIDNNLKVIQRLHDTMGAETMHEYLMQEDTISELKKKAKAAGGEMKSDYQAHIKMPQAAVEFGPKLGAFYANLMGAHGYLTMDRWWSRTFNRYRGTLLTAPTRQGLDRFKQLLGNPELSDDEALAATVEHRKSYEAKGFKNGTEIEKAANTVGKAAFDNLEDAPFNATDRTFMLDAVNKAQKALKRKGINLSIADIQAILWYYEKRLYGELGARQTADISYEEAAQRVASGYASGSGIESLLDDTGAAPGDGGTNAGGVSPGEELYQSADGVLEQQARGTFNPQTLLISLGPQSDLSTFLHESGHFFLEVMADLAALPDAPAQVREDMDKVLTWFGVPDLATWQGYTLDQKREHHERWAESFEQYLLEGKAPSAELQPLFRRFRAWLVNVYTSLTDFMRGRNLEVNDEIRQVFDRMLATDEAIAQAEEQAGLLPDFDATNAAIERLQERSMRALKWTLNARSKFLKQFTKEARELRKGVLAEVMAEFEQRPDVMASRAIRKVRNKDGAERDAKIAAIADATGYATVEEMTAAVTALGPVNEAVEAEVDRRMLERHGDMATQEALEAAANEAVHNEARARALAAELKSQDEALNPRETTGRTDTRGRPITVNALVEAARAFGADLAARRQIGKLKNAIYLHRAAEARAGKAWQTATKKGDTKAAVQAKKDQLLNNQAVRALLDAQAEVRSAIEFFRKVTKGNNEKLVKGGRDPDVVNAMRAILGVYGIAPRTGKGAMEYLELVQKNDPAMYAVIAPGVNTALANAKPFSELTVEEVRGLTDELKSLWHLAKRSRQMEIDGDLLDLEDLADQLYARMEDIGIPDVLPGETGALTDAELRKRNWLQQAPAILRRVEQWAEAKDGAFGGPFLRFIFQPVKIAADRYRTDRLVYRQKFQALVDAIAPTMAKTIIAAPELDYTFGRGHNGIGMAEVLHAILHTGNDSNKRKLLLGRNWATENPDGTLDTSRWDAFIARLITEGTLTKAHYDFAQGVWDLMEETKPLAQKTHRDVFGRYFAEVTANEVQTPFGTYRGGYVPAQADPLLVQDADQRELLETENAGMSYAFPATNKGFTKGRVEYNRPLKLDLRTLPQHIDKVLLFSHMEPAVRGVDRLLRRKKIAQALNKIDPAAINGMLKPWLNRSARQTVETPVSADAGMNRMLSQARARTGMALMMGNVSNTLQQITGFSTALLKVKGSHMRRAVAQYIADPKQLKNTVWALSPYMADRASNEVAVLSDTLEAILLNPSVYQSTERFTRRHAYFLQTGMDNQMSPIIWTGAYNQALAEGMGDRMARRFADGVIRQTQGSTLPEDVSRIETGTAFARAFTQFVGYFNMLANTNATAIQQIAQEQGLRKGAGKAFGVLMLGMMIPIWVAEVIAQAFRGGPEDDEDDGYLDDWLAAVFGFGTIRGILSGVPGIAQIGQSMVNRFNDNPADDKFSLSPTVSVLESAAAAPQSVYKAIADEGSAQKAVRDMSALITVTTGLPAMTLARPLGYAAGVAQGKIEPTGPADFARGMVTGTASPESKNP